MKSEKNHEEEVNVHQSRNSWESKNLIDEGAKSGLGGLSMPVVGGESGEMKKESKLIQVEVNEMEQATIVEL